MKPVAYMIWAPFTGPAQFTTDPRAIEITARRADYTCTPLVTEQEALAAIEQARREEREACAQIALQWKRGYVISDRYANAQKGAMAGIANAIRARGEGKT